MSTTSSNCCAITGRIPRAAILSSQTRPGSSRPRVHAFQYSALWRPVRIGLPALFCYHSSFRLHPGLSHQTACTYSDQDSHYAVSARGNRTPRTDQVCCSGHSLSVDDGLMSPWDASYGSFIPPEKSQPAHTDVTSTGFTGHAIFNSLYRAHVTAAYHEATKFNDEDMLLPHLLLWIERHLDKYVRHLDRRYLVPASLHLENLAHFKARLIRVSCDTSCFSCLLRMPEHVLHAGHALCSERVHILGTPVENDPYRRSIAMCPLCQVRLVPGPHTIALQPPTAGHCVLTMDGGGVRGILELELLQLLEETVQFPDPPRVRYDGGDEHGRANSAWTRRKRMVCRTLRRAIRDAAGPSVLAARCVKCPCAWPVAGIRAGVSDS